MLYSERTEQKIEKRTKKPYENVNTRRKVFDKSITKRFNILILLEDYNLAFHKRIPQLLLNRELSVKDYIYSHTFNGYIRYIVKKDFESEGIPLFNPSVEEEIDYTPFYEKIQNASNINIVSSSSIDSLKTARNNSLQEFCKPSSVLLFTVDYVNILSLRIPMLLQKNELRLKSVVYNNSISGYFRYLMKKDFESVGLVAFNPLFDAEYKTHN